ncbi:hypothetical protein J6590_085206 [Homalodisca vitripennis]|nr:hypothetical protein J6590_085206 [Homalodisca vitripennis]
MGGENLGDSEAIEKIVIAMSATIGRRGGMTPAAKLSAICKHASQIQVEEFKVIGLSRSGDRELALSLTSECLNVPKPHTNARARARMYFNVLVKHWGLSENTRHGFAAIFLIRRGGIGTTAVGNGLGHVTCLINKDISVTESLSNIVRDIVTDVGQVTYLIIRDISVTECISNIVRDVVSPVDVGQVTYLIIRDISVTECLSNNVRYVVTDVGQVTCLIIRDISMTECLSNIVSNLVSMADIALYSASNIQTRFVSRVLKTASYNRYKIPTTVLTIINVYLAYARRNE